ncbi:MAG: M23 family metallopeptidase [Alphaproteobacteria bacterium]
MKWMMAALLVAVPAWAEPALEVVNQNLQPGGFMVGRVEQGSVVRWNDVKIPVNAEGLFVVGFDRFAGKNQDIQVCVNAECTTTPLTLASRTYKVQNVKGVPAKTVNPSPAELKRMAADNAAIAAARKTYAGLNAFAGPFVLPVQAETSGVFGSRRTYNGEERSWHKGHDLAARTGTPVYAPADGIVRLARSTFMSGNLVILDHGSYITSLYAHLDSMAVNVGDTVKQGDMVGRVGTTGRSTGPHLHWGMNWKSVAIDPALWVGHTLPKEEDPHAE